MPFNFVVNLRWQRLHFRVAAEFSGAHMIENSWTVQENVLFRFWRLRALETLPKTLCRWSILAPELTTCQVLLSGFSKEHYIFKKRIFLENHQKRVRHSTFPTRKLLENKSFFDT